MSEYQSPGWQPQAALPSQQSHVPRPPVPSILPTRPESFASGRITPNPSATAVTRGRGTFTLLEANSDAWRGVTSAPFTFALSGTLTMFVTFLAAFITFAMTNEEQFRPHNSQVSIPTDHVWLIAFSGFFVWGFLSIICNMYIVSMLRAGRVRAISPNWGAAVGVVATVSCAATVLCLIPIVGFFLSLFVTYCGSLWLAIACHTGSFQGSLTQSVSIVQRNTGQFALLMMAVFLYILVGGGLCNIAIGFAVALHSWLMHAAYFQCEGRPWLGPRRKKQLL